MESPEDSRDLVERLYLVYSPRLSALARILTGTLESGDDLVQDVFLKLLKKCQAQPDYVREPAWPLLRVMLVRLAVVRRRSVVRELRRVVGMYERPPENTWDTDIDVIRALMTLPPRMRACVVLHYLEDLSIADVAAAMGTGSGTVSAHLQAARKRLRKQLRFVHGDVAGEAEARIDV